MITMYERTIEYSNVCLSAQDHEIKFLFQRQLIGYETPNSERKGCIWYSREALKT